MPDEPLVCVTNYHPPTCGSPPQVCLDTLRQQVQGQWTTARLRACLPRLQRFLVMSPRRREHQETRVRTWLDRRAPAQGVPLQAAA